MSRFLLNKVIINKALQKCRCAQTNFYRCPIDKQADPSNKKDLRLFAASNPTKRRKSQSQLPRYHSFLSSKRIHSGADTPYLCYGSTRLQLLSMILLQPLHGDFRQFTLMSRTDRHLSEKGRKCLLFHFIVFFYGSNYSTGFFECQYFFLLSYVFFSKL